MNSCVDTLLLIRRFGRSLCGAFARYDRRNRLDHIWLGGDVRNLKIRISVYPGPGLSIHLLLVLLDMLLSFAKLHLIA